MIEIRKFCECGCGELIKSGNRFVFNHHRKGKLGTFVGRHHTQETLDKISKALTGRVFSEETLKKFSDSKRGVSKSEEHNRKNSEAHKGKIFTEEHKRNLAKAKEGKVLSEEHRKNIKLSKLGKKRAKHTDGTRKKLSKKMLLSWQNPEYVKKQMLSRKAKQNKAEKKLEGILSEIQPNEWKFVGDGKVIIAGKCPDFINVNGHKKIIELYGDYWHRNDNPQTRIDLFSKFGFSTLVIWERELMDIKSVESKIKLFTIMKGESNERKGK